MSSNRSPAAAAVRARLNHPVIDSDGHWMEFGPQVADKANRALGRILKQNTESVGGAYCEDISKRLATT